MPKELFEPSTSTHTAIALFKANVPQNNKKVYFYNLSDDGFILSKDKGRRDSLGKWEKIKSELLSDIKNRKEIPYKSKLVDISADNMSEWILQAHTDTDFSGLINTYFEHTMQEFIIYEAKKNMNILDKDINEIELLQLLNEYLSNQEKIILGEEYE